LYFNFKYGELYSNYYTFIFTEEGTEKKGQSVSFGIEREEASVTYLYYDGGGCMR